MKTIMQNLKGLSIAVIGGCIALKLDFPLPWLLGPLIISILANAFKFKTDCHIAWRKSGQWIIGTGLGLYFTPQMVNLIFNNIGALALGVLWALVLGCIFSLIQYRYHKLDWATAWFSSCIGGASEMVNLAQRYNAEADKVAASHSLRIVLLVIIVPIFIQLNYSVNSDTLTYKIYPDHNSLDLILLLILSLLGVKAAQFLNILNPWVLGPIMMIGILTFFDFKLGVLPQYLIAFGQLCIGWSLGSKLPLNFFRLNQGFVLLSLTMNIVALVFSIVLAQYIAQYFSVDPATMVLGFAPGGIAEMALIAKALNLVVPLVVAYQLLRLIVVLVTCDFFYRLGLKLLKSLIKNTDNKSLG